MNIGFLFALIVIITGGMAANFKRYKNNEITKKALVTNFVTVTCLLVAGIILLNLK